MSCESQLARYKVLMEMARCFGRPMDLETLIDEILNRSQVVMNAEACTLFLPDPRTNELILHSTDPRLAALPQPLRVPPGKGIAGAVFQTRTPVNVRDAMKDPRYFQAIAQRVGFETRAMLAIPLLDGADCVGVLQALNPSGRECFDADDEEIFEGFGGLIANALRRIEAGKHEIEIARSKQEMLVAREIQESFLPPSGQKFPCAEVWMSYTPAAAVGGDFCCVHPVGEDRLLLGLGDVTGKGVPAALTMARATAMIAAMIDQLEDDLGKWVSALNEQLTRDLQSGRFIAITFMLADARREEAQICAAGQFAPLRFEGERWRIFELQNHLPLGIAQGIQYQAATAKLHAGEAWLLFSDGVPEARNGAGEDFTVARFENSLTADRPLSRALGQSVAVWKDFISEAPQHDDASMLLLDWRGRAPAGELKMMCSTECLCEARAFVERWAAHAGFDDVTSGQIALGCDEAVTNIFRHAYREQPGPLRCRARLIDEALEFELEDQAGPIDVAAVKGRELEDLRPGGLGTVIMSKVFEEVIYQPSPAGTRLLLRKRLPR